MIVPPAKVLEHFVIAGWHEKRCVPVLAFVAKNHPASQVLAQFGGLTVGTCGPGIECSSSDIVFGASKPDDGDDELTTWQELLKTRLVSIADVHHGHGELLIDMKSRCYGRSYIHEAFYFEGNCFETAISNVLLGIRSRPMLRPDQDSVTLYGVDYTAESPETYHYTRQS